MSTSAALARSLRPARLLRPRGARGCAGPTGGTLSRAPNGGLEFTVAPYLDVPELGFNRFQEFCMLTLQHPSFEGTTEESRSQLYEQKRADREKRARKIFTEEDRLGTESLDIEELKRAVSRIGLANNEASLAGILQRHSSSTMAEGGVSFQEFLSVIVEAWGRVENAEFSDQLAQIHRGVPGHEPIEGLRAFSWLGRASPANYVLRSIRNLWPYACRRVALLRNKAYNPSLDPDLMEVLLDTHEGGRVRGANTVEDLARLASAQPHTAEGGLAVRIELTASSIERWPHADVPLESLSTLKQEEAALAEARSAYHRGEPVVSDEEYDKLREAVRVSARRKIVCVPVRGLPENSGPGGLHRARMFWRKLTS